MKMSKLHKRMNEITKLSNLQFKNLYIYTYYKRSTGSKSWKCPLEDLKRLRAGRYASPDNFHWITFKRHLYPVTQPMSECTAVLSRLYTIWMGEPSWLKNLILIAQRNICCQRHKSLEINIRYSISMASWSHKQYPHTAIGIPRVGGAHTYIYWNSLDYQLSLYSLVSSVMSKL